MYNYAKNGGDLDVLLTGKVTLDYKDTIEKLQHLGLAIPSQYYTDSYVSNNNSNTNLDFILKSLK